MFVQKLKLLTREQNLELARTVKPHYRSGTPMTVAASRKLEKFTNIMLRATQGRDDEDFKAEAPDWEVYGGPELFEMAYQQRHITRIA